MKYGVRRRTIDLLPPTQDDIEWAFASGGPSSKGTRAAAKTAYQAGKFVLGIIHKNAEKKRVGFVMLIPVGGDHWDFTVMIPSKTDRDLFSALHACDAAARYMFDAVGMVAAVWRIREDNVRAQMLCSRFRYPQNNEVEQEGHRYLCFILDRSTWAARTATLEKRGGGAAFEDLR
jgi:hypothetical protein